MKYLLGVWLRVVSSVFILAFLISCTISKVDEPIFKTENLHSQPNKITILRTASETVFEIKSEFGIGKAKVELVKGTWPQKVVIRLFLKGLEGFTLSGSNLVLEKSDLIITRKELNGSTCFEVVLPPKLLKTSNQINLNWIDFYR